MDRYRVTVNWYPYTGLAIDLSSAVSGAVSITNGRTDLSTSIGQNFGSLTFLKSQLWNIVAANGYQKSAFSFGSLVSVSIGEVMTSADNVLFLGNITDISSDAYEITFSLVSNWVYKMTGFLPYSYAGTTDTTTAIVLDVAQNTGGGLVDAFVGDSENTITVGPAEIANGLTYLSSIIPQSPSQYLFVDPWRDAWQLTERPPLGAFPDVVIAGDDVLLDYSLDRSVEDVSNRVSVIYDGGTFERTNATSVDRIGQRFQEIETTIGTEDDAEKLGYWFLGAHAPDGFPLITFRTTAELLGYSIAWIAENIQPNRVLDLTAVNAEGFDDFAYIEQLRYTITRSQWRIELIASNSDYSDLPQKWNQITSGIKWDDILNDPPSVVTWDDLLYIRL
jgi:hypothetical protein